MPSLRDGWLVAGALAADDVQFARHEAGLLEIEVGIDDISPTGCIRSLSRAVYHDDVNDYSTNEPTMDGTASAILLFALLG